MTRIALLRHFPTCWNKQRRFQGQTDIPLTEDSRQKLRALAIPAPWNAARIIASPLSRATETAHILARGRAVTPDPRLVEINFGKWEGMHGVDLLADPNSGYVNVEDSGWHRRAPNGESPWDVWERVQPALAEIAADPAPALLIVHRALMRVILARAWDWHFDSPEPFKIKPGRIYPLTLLPDGTPTAPEEPDRLESFP
ncbi:MAG TPA: histidine phosphatase family protein [Thermohalobaculum sp.]|nr:histidine phosphatase family protein [Thermohalobaculum sp.]